MAINTFHMTCCTVLATLASASAMAFIAPPSSGDTQAGTAAARQPAAIVSFDASTFGRPMPMPGVDGGAGSMAQLVYGSVGDIAYHVGSQAQATPASEPAKLPLLGAAAIALLVAQLRRSGRPSL